MDGEGRPAQSGNFLNSLALRIRERNLSLQTERTYLHWTARYLRFCRAQNLLSNQASSVESFLEYLAGQLRVSQNTQKVALNALVFVFKHLFNQSEVQLSFRHAKRQRRLPTVLSDTEARAVLSHLHGTHRLIGALLYGSGLRLAECLALRIKDIDFDLNIITVRSGKGDKDRTTLMPKNCVVALKKQVQLALLLHQRDRLLNMPGVYLPTALNRKYPSAGTEFAWFWLFPAMNYSRDPRSGVRRRHHLFAQAFPRELKKATRRAQVYKRVTSHTFRHSFATRLLELGYDIRTIQELLGHTDVSTTEIYTHVIKKGAREVISPLD